MLRQCHIYAVSKQISERITSHNKLYDTITRAFYNDKDAATFLTEDIRKRDSIRKSKEEIDNKLQKKVPTISRTKLLIGTTEVPNVHDFSTFNLREWWANQKKEFRKYVQRQSYKKHLLLGPDLAAAHFVISCGGRVKFKDHSNWIEAIEKRKVPKEVPKDYDPEYLLEAIDLRGHPIDFDNLVNILNLYHLKWLSLRGCETIDDWAIDKLSTGYPMLEHFDISDCINVSERGLEALYRMPNLKKLIVTNYNNSVTLELTCFMLEDINPFLNCEILEAEKKLLAQGECN